MDAPLWSLALLALSAATAIAGALVWLAQLLSSPRPPDPAPAKGSTAQGVAYALTLGMAPWRKESTRRHWPDYLRGIVFHAGIFAALLSLALSLAWGTGPTLFRATTATLSAVGAAAGIVGLAVRTTHGNLRRLSRPDDYLSPAFVTLFLAAATGFLLQAVDASTFYVMSSAMLMYLPLSKVRHCLYFFYSRYYFGNLFGRRGVLAAGHNDTRGTYSGQP